LNIFRSFFFVVDQDKVEAFYFQPPKVSNLKKAEIYWYTTLKISFNALQRALLKTRQHQRSQICLRMKFHRRISACNLGRALLPEERSADALRPGKKRDKILTAQSKRPWLTLPPSSALDQNSLATGTWAFLPLFSSLSLFLPLPVSLPPSLSEAALLPLEELKVVGAMLNLTSSLVFFLCAS